jgi:phosphatidylinositol alpha-1,6-mannosyltransferase
MRILYISHSHPQPAMPLDNMGGMQRVSHQLVDALDARADVQVDRRILDASWSEIVSGTARFIASLFARLPVIVHETKPDVILFSSMVTASLAVPLRGRIGIPMVTINHGQDVTLPNPLYQWFVPKVFRALDGVISVSQATREACIQRGMDPGKGVALPNGFEPSAHADLPAYEVARRQLAQRLETDLTGKHVLLSVGRLVKRKGHAWFVGHVMAKLDSETVYVVVGEGPERPAIEAAAAHAGVSDRVWLMGRQGDSLLRTAYAAADLFVMPNVPVPGDMEGFGVVLLEANAAGLPAVAADLEGIRDVIENGHNGWKVPAADVEAWVEAVMRSLARNRESAGIRARSHVLEHFAWPHVAGRYVDYLRAVASKGARRTD